MKVSGCGCCGRLFLYMLSFKSLTFIFGFLSLISGFFLVHTARIKYVAESMI